MYLHFIYADSIPIICRTIEETIVFIGILIFLYKMFTLFDFKYESDVTYKDKPSDNHIWYYREYNNKPVQKEENTDGSSEN